MTALRDWSTTAVNLPEHADNPIHTDAGARAAGFESALVAGVTTYAYLTHVPATAWGLDWIGHGGAEVRFLRPVLAGDRVDCLVGDDGRVVASVDGEERVAATFVERAPTVERRDGDLLEPVELVLGARWADYGVRSGDDCPLYLRESIVHPTTWPRIANGICHTQLVVGSWIHTRSRITHLGLALIGSTVRAESRLVDRFDSRSGVRSVIDVWITADGTPVAHLEHEAITELT